MSKNFINRLSDFLVSYFSFSGQLVSQQQAEESIRDGVSFRGTNLLILVLAILIASLGLNTNSTAVIIGAMLISPLMGPIIGVGLGIGIRDFALIKRSLRNLIMAAGFSVLASTVFFLISPVNEQHSELLARTSPTIYDVLIGFVGGGAGIVALGSTSKGNVIPGVAIATALMPPLCTAGYGLATWQLTYFFGAFYLFLINSIYIAVATFIGVKLMKYKCIPAADPVRSRNVMRIVYAVAVLTMLPSIYLTYKMLRENRFSVDADRFISHECEFPDTQVLNRKLYYKDGRRYLSITLIGQPLPIDSLRTALTPKLRYYGLAGTNLSFIQGGVYEKSSAVNSTASAQEEEVYRLAQNTITRQQTTIDSLQAVIAISSTASNGAVKVAPEIKALFPTVQQIGVSTTVFALPESAKTDTVTVAMVNVAGGYLSRTDRSRLADYLQVRLEKPDVRLIVIPAL